MFNKKKINEYDKLLLEFNRILVDADESKISWFIKNINCMVEDDVMDLAITAHKEIRLIPSHKLQSHWFEMLMSCRNKYFQSMIMHALCSEDCVLDVKTKRLDTGVFAHEVTAYKDGYGIQFQYLIDNRMEKDNIAFNSIPYLLHGFYNTQNNPFFIWKEIQSHIPKESIESLFNNKESLFNGFLRTNNFINTLPYNPEVYCNFITYFNAIKNNAIKHNWLEEFSEVEKNYYIKIMDENKKLMNDGGPNRLTMH